MISFSENFVSFRYPRKFAKIGNICQSHKTEITDYSHTDVPKQWTFCLQVGRFTYLSTSKKVDEVYDVENQVSSRLSKGWAEIHGFLQTFKEVAHSVFYGFAIW
ncbi:MAG TPA: hypothetical protein DIW30_02690 [Bacteroidales bacterium]|nr:hypothetical protein [Bacteroidales bacterium]